MSTPATVEIWESNGTSGAQVHTKATSLNFGSIDSPNIVAADHPLVIPAAGNIYSYDKETRWKVTAWVDTTLIDNLKWFKSAGSNAATWQEQHGVSATQTYVTPDRTGNNCNSTPWPTTAGTAVAITGSFSTPTTGYGSGYYVIQTARISSTTVAGLKGSHTITYRYDES